MEVFRPDNRLLGHLLLPPAQRTPIRILLNSDPELDRCIQHSVTVKTKFHSLEYTYALESRSRINEGAGVPFSYRWHSSES